MTHREESDPELMREAAGWFARMRAPDAEQSRPSFEAWLAADPDHRRAYNRASEVFAMGKLLARPQRPGEPARPSPRRVPAAAAALVALAGTGWFLMRTPPASEAGPTVASIAARPTLLAAPADRARKARLGDGSTLLLAAETRVAVAYTPAERRLVLLEGRARFEVFHEPRPFIVSAGGGTVTARGTAFDVWLGRDGRVNIHLLRGKVDVAMPASPSRATALRRLGPGERITYLATGKASAAGKSPLLVQEFPRGGSDYDSVPLASLVADANRRAAKPIELARPGLGDRRVSGRFRIDDTERLAERLALLFDLQVDRRDPAKLRLVPRQQ